MADVRIPSSIEEATEALGTLDALLTAKGWERAAIVWAFTKNDGRGGRQGNDGSPTLTVAQFSRLGVRGLATRETVAHYRAAWATVVETHGDPQPGRTVLLPDPVRYPFPPAYESNSSWTSIEDREEIEAKADEVGTGRTIALQVAKNPEAMKAAILASPKVAAAAAAAVAEAGRAGVSMGQLMAEHVANLPRIPVEARRGPDENLDGLTLLAALASGERAVLAIADAVRRPIVDPELRDAFLGTVEGMIDGLNGAKQLAAGFDPEDLLR